MHRPPLTLVCFGVVFLPILVLTFLQPNIVELNPAGNCIQILSSLSTVTPTPQPTVSFEVPTWQPPVSTQFPPSTPSAKIDHYQLNSWSEVEAENVLAIRLSFI
jgi:hypothetical protein